MSYLLRNIDPQLWRTVKAKAAMQGESIRDVITRALQAYVKPK